MEKLTMINDLINFILSFLDLNSKLNLRQTSKMFLNIFKSFFFNFKFFLKFIEKNLKRTIILNIFEIPILSYKNILYLAEKLINLKKRYMTKKLSKFNFFIELLNYYSNKNNKLQFIKIIDIKTYYFKLFFEEYFFKLLIESNDQLSKFNKLQVKELSSYCVENNYYAKKIEYHEERTNDLKKNIPGHLFDILFPKEYKLEKINLFFLTIYGKQYFY